MNKKLMASVAFIAATGMVLGGCGKKEESSAPQGEIILAEDGTIYPMSASEGELSLSVFTPIDSETEKIKYWSEATGVKLEFASSKASEALSLMLASNDLSDVIIADLATQPGGVQKYADDGVIVDITEHIDEYAPNLKAWFDKDETIRKMATTDDGKHYFFPCIRAEAVLRSYRGFVARKDLLDKYGLTEPETIEEWENVLKTFKDNGMSAPLSYDMTAFEPAGGFMSAYGVIPNFYLENGEVKYGYLEDGMKEALKTLSRWYSEGLLDKDIINASSNQDLNLTNNKTGMTFLTSGGGMGKYLRPHNGGDESFDLVGLKLPVLNKGDKPKFSSSTFPITTANNGFITSQCENIELAMRFLDFGYSEEGNMLMNFGKEGVSYEMVDGYPKYTELIMNNPDGKSVGDTMTEYFFSNWAGPFAQDVRYIEQYNQFPRQQEALKLWGEMMTMESTMPQVTFTTEETAKISSIMNNINTCANENMFKFIMGIKSVDADYEAFVAELKAFGIDEAIEIYKAALTRYNNR